MLRLCVLFQYCVHCVGLGSISVLHFLRNIPVSCRFGIFLVLPGNYLDGLVRICTHISKNLGWGRFLMFVGSLLYIASKYVFYFCCPNWVYFIVWWFYWPLSRPSAYCRVPMGSLSSDSRSICIWDSTYFVKDAFHQAVL